MAVEQNDRTFLHNAAREYAQAGIAVFPLKPREKTPIYNGGFHQATTDLNQVDAWWTEHPYANIGVPTGPVNGFLVVDPDGEIAVKWLELLAKNHGFVLNGPCAITGSNGQHWIFKDDPRIHSVSGAYAENIDSKAKGGYIVVAPSVHPDTGQEYRWATALIGAEIPELPKPLLDVYLEREKKRVNAAVRGGPIPLGIQETTLASIAGAMRRRGAEVEEIEAALLVAAKRCDPPMLEKDALRIARSINRYDPASPLVTAPLTDLGNAERFAYVNADRAMYVGSEDAWYVWDGTRWARTAGRKIDRLAKETARAFQITAAEMDPNDPNRATTMDWAMRLDSDRYLKAMIAWARSELEVDAETLDADPWLLNCANGTVDLRTRELRPHDPTDRITKITPVAYDPEARDEDWDGLLARATEGKEGLADFLQVAAGYSACGDTREDKFFMVLGKSRSGKSTFIEAVKAALGDYSETAGFDTFVKRRNDSGIREDIARLNKKRFVSAVEVEDGKTLAAALIKSLTGGEKIAARFLFKDTFAFKPELKLWLVANDPPHVSSENEAMWERIFRIPFDNVVPREERDLGLKDRLINPEKCGKAVLAWIVEGCLRWQREGLTPPAVVMLATQQYQQDEEPIKDFIDEELEIGEGKTIAVTGLRKLFDIWAKANGETARIGRKAFNARMEALGYERGRIGGDYVWKGLGLHMPDMSGGSQRDLEPSGDGFETLWSTGTAGQNHGDAEM